MTDKEFFARYQFDSRTDRIGGGAFGTVYRAYDLTLDRYVAIKIAEVKYIEGKEFSLIDEVNATKSLPAHKNIANYEEVYQIQMPNGLYGYAIMQHYEEGNLKELLQKNKLSDQQKLKICTGLLTGLAYLHDQRIIHRDLKPSNILISKYNDSYTPKISDFGLSKLIGNEAYSAITNSFGGGTLEYSSPEQLYGHRVNYNSDIWSLGIIFYEIWQGLRPFTADTATGQIDARRRQVFQNIANADIPDAVADCPFGFAEVIRQCLRKDPKERVSHTSQLVPLIIIPGDQDLGTNAHDSADDTTVVPAAATVVTKLFEPTVGQTDDTVVTTLNFKEREERERALEEKQRAEQERQEKEQARIEEERIEQERFARERKDKERAEKEKAEQERAEQARIEKEKADEEKAERERAARDKAEQKRKGREQAAKAKAAREQAEKEKLAQERAERERAAAEQERLRLTKLEEQKAKAAARQQEQERKAAAVAQRKEEKAKQLRINKEKREQDRIAQQRKKEAEKAAARQKKEAARINQQQKQPVAAETNQKKGWKKYLLLLFLIPIGFGINSLLQRNVDAGKGKETIEVPAPVGSPTEPGVPGGILPVDNETNDHQSDKTLTTGESVPAAEQGIPAAASDQATETESPPPSPEDTVSDRLETQSSSQTAAAARQLWEDITTNPTMENIRSFLEQHPQSEDAAKAKLLLSKVEKQEASQIEQAWSEILADPSEERIEAFMKKYPASVHTEEAEQLLSQIEASAEEKIKQGLNEIIANPTKQNLESIIEQYPERDEAQVARDMLREMESAALLTKKQVDVSSNEAVKPVLSSAAAEAVTVINAEVLQLPRGNFLLGCRGKGCANDEGPAKEVTVGGFIMSKHEVTQNQYEAIMGTNPSEFQLCGGCPVENVSFQDALTFIKKLNQADPGKNYRLPTEAEWEYAATAGQDFTYAGSNKLGDIGYYKKNSRNGTQTVGQKRANAFGLHDMSGNVSEWCTDWYDKDAYAKSSEPVGTAKVIRGGSWADKSDYCRINNRRFQSPNDRTPFVGIRLVRDL